MRRSTLRRVQPLVAGLVLMASLSFCGGNSPGPGGRQTATVSPSPELELFTADELEVLVIPSTDPPAGMQFSQENSGPATLEGSFAANQHAKLRELGLTSTYYSNFYTQGYDRNAPNVGSQGAWYLWSIAVLFEDEEGAKDGSAYIRDNPSTELLSYKLRSRPGIVKDDWSFQAIRDYPEGQDTPEIGFVWRIGNVLLFVQAQGLNDSGELGTLKPDEVLEVAKNHDRRFASGV